MKKILLLTASAVLLLGFDNLYAQNTANYFIGGSNGSTMTAANWSLGTLPNVANDATFAGATPTGIRSMTAGSLTVGSYNVTTNAGTYGIRNQTSGASSSTLTLGGSGNLGNGVSGNSADLLYVNQGATLNIWGTNGSSGTGGLNVVLGQSGNFNIAGKSEISAGISGGYGITKTGTGTMTFSGTNTYTGNTTVTGGTLSLADNAQLRFTIGATGVNNLLTQSGTGTVSLDGDFVFDLSNAGTTIGNSWTLTSGTINYGGSLGTFSVLSTAGAFTETFSGSRIWTYTNDLTSATYEFSELNSQLTVVVPEPSTYAMLALSGLGFAGYVIRRRRR